MDAADVEEWRGRILRMRRQAYENELTIQAQKVGCNRVGRLAESDILSQLNNESQRAAESIVSTFNYHLAAAIVNIRSEVPTANRHVYASRIAEWERGYWSWKLPQIQEDADRSARARAQQDFARLNVIMGSAKLEPTRAVCPVCKGWARRGIVPMRVALNNPPPYHPNCFPPDETVLLPDGNCKPISSVDAGETVLTRSGGRRVAKVFRRYTEEEVYHIFAGGLSVRLTGDHPVLTRRGWIEARYLQAGDEVATVNFHECGPDGMTSKQ
jgi:hypothetical protein